MIEFFKFDSIETRCSADGFYMTQADVQPRRDGLKRQYGVAYKRVSEILFASTKCVPLVLYALAILGFLCFGEPMIACGQSVSSPRPLADVADKLENVFGKPVTYEDPMLEWSGDLQSFAGVVGLYPRIRSFEIPSGLISGQGFTTAEVPLNEILKAYQSQTDGPRFKVLTSSWGLHIVPSEVRDRNGVFAQTKSVMDYVIDVPIAKRTPSEHLAAICKAIANSSGIKVGANDAWLTQLYGPNGIAVITGGLMPPKEVLKRLDALSSINWGVTRKIARDALLDLLKGSASTVSWRVFCDSKECGFNLMSMNLYQDRKKLKKLDE
jgi:hypothetical protein